MSDFFLVVLISVLGIIALTFFLGAVILSLASKIAGILAGGTAILLLLWIGRIVQNRVRGM